MIFNVGFLGGIGFTMSIFITLLAFDNESIIDNAKLVIVLSSLVAGQFVGADPARYHRQRQGDQGGRVAEQTGVALCLRSRDRSAGVAD